jgi:hypothetical protein
MPCYAFLDRLGFLSSISFITCVIPFEIAFLIYLALPGGVWGRENVNVCGFGFQSLGHSIWIQIVHTRMPRPTNQHHHNRQHYSKDLRDRVIWQKFTLQKVTSEIATDLNMSLRVVQRIIKMWREIGDVVASPRNLSRSPTMSEAQIQVRSHLFMPNCLWPRASFSSLFWNIRRIFI